jgi:hypothetical protein
MPDTAIEDLRLYVSALAKLEHEVNVLSDTFLNKPCCVWTGNDETAARLISGC